MNILENVLKRQELRENFHSQIQELETLLNDNFDTSDADFEVSYDNFNNELIVGYDNKTLRISVYCASDSQFDNGENITEQDNEIVSFIEQHLQNESE